MATSVYFNSNSGRNYNEQGLLEDMIIESIRNHGIDVYYLPRSSQSELDPLFGDDPVRYYNKAFKIEVYLESFKDYDGNKEFFSKFGLEIQETARLCIARRRYEQTIMKNIGDGMNHHVPKEGDLLYLPIQYKLMEIKFVEDEKNFFQLGRDSINPYMYGLSVEAYKYNGELIQTGVAEVDSVANKQAITIDFNLSTQYSTGSYTQYEWVYQGDSLQTATAKAIVANWDKPTSVLSLRNIRGTFTTGFVKGNDSKAQFQFVSADVMQNSNEYTIDDNILIKNEANDILDFSENNPFGDPSDIF